MKFVHLLPILGIAAVFGATRQASNSSAAAEQPGSAALASVVPPWLTGALPEETIEDEGGVVGALDPDIDVCAGVYGAGSDGADPHAELCADADPHAGLHVDADPHAGIAGADVPHAERDADQDPYERVGIAPAPEVAIALNIERSRAPNGRTVAEVFAERAALAGKPVVVRGTVVKLIEGVLGKTYLHLRDGSGSPGGEDDDLTATTTERFELGQTLEVEGVLAIDQDVGAGYRYAALLTAARPASR
jgi:hypothetical protein